MEDRQPEVGAQAGADEAEAAPGTTPPPEGLPAFREDVSALVADLGDVPVHLPGSPGYDELTLAMDAELVRTPALVAVPRTPEEVAHVVQVAGEHGVPVAVQATGHGASALLDGALLLSTTALDHLTVLPALGTAHVGAGVRWKAVVEAAAPYGLAPVTGAAPGVGVVGYLTGGGHGPLARSLGISSDRVRAFDVVTGDGVLRRATATDEPDLFWGLRGGRGALGVVTSVELDLLDQPEIYGGAVVHAEEDVDRVVEAWAAWAPQTPLDATTSLAIMRLPEAPGIPPFLAGRTTVSVRFGWTGDPQEGAEVLAPMRALATPVVDTVEVLPYSRVGEIHDDPGGRTPFHDTHALLEDLGPEAVERFLELVGAGSACVHNVVEVRHLGGAAAQVPAAPDAVPGRSATWSLFMIGIAPVHAAGPVRADARRILEGLAPWTRAGALPNFAPGHDRAWAERTYPGDVLTRLGEVSRRYDPAGVLLASHPFRPV